MPYKKITCRIAIQICVGRFPDGRERHRTFSLKDIRPDVSSETIRDIIRALAPLLEYPITKVTKVTKRVIFSIEDERAERTAPDAAPRAAVPAPRVVTEHPAIYSDGYRRGTRPPFCRGKRISCTGERRREIAATGGDGSCSERSGKLTLSRKI